MRLNKLISDSGLCSRRDADLLIEHGRVTVNGAPAALGAVVEPADEVLIDGQPLTPRTQRKRVYIALYKPVGITCTTETDVAGNIVDFVDHNERIFPIGRLDKDSEGLILLTNDGDIVNRLLRAEHQHEKEYLVAIDRPVTPELVTGLARGVRILGRRTRPARAWRVSKYVFRIVLTEGMNRQIRRMCEVFDCHVKQLRRVRFVNITLGRLKCGQWRNLTPEEVQGLTSGRPGTTTPERSRATPAATALESRRARARPLRASRNATGRGAR